MPFWPFLDMELAINVSTTSRTGSENLHGRATVVWPCRSMIGILLDWLSLSFDMKVLGLFSALCVLERTKSLPFKRRHISFVHFFLILRFHPNFVLVVTSNDKTFIQNIETYSPFCICPHLPRPNKGKPCCFSFKNNTH